MDFQYSDKVKELRQQLLAFMDEYIYPNEEVVKEQKAANSERGRAYAKVPIIDELKEKAKAQGLWNLFLPEEEYGPGLTNLESSRRPGCSPCWKERSVRLSP